MKRLSDYKGEEAIDLWADLIDPLITIMTDEKVVKKFQEQGTPIVKTASFIVKEHKKEVAEILTRIDEKEITGTNFPTRAVNLILDIINSEEAKGFFDLANSGVTSQTSSGFATENTEQKGN